MIDVTDRTDIKVRFFTLKLLFAHLILLMICQLLCESKTRPQLLHRPGKAQERDRTADLVLTKDVLYRLSYLGISVDDLSIWLMLVSSRQRPRALRHQPHAKWSGKRDSNPRPQAWKACALPTELFPQNWWRGKDSNLRRHRRQIYSLLPLATREPLLDSLHPFNE